MRGWDVCIPGPAQAAPGKAAYFALREDQCTCTIAQPSLFFSRTMVPVPKACTGFPRELPVVSVSSQTMAVLPSIRSLCLSSFLLVVLV